MDVTYRKVEDVEQALDHLMYQFRQINQRYGLIVDEEINILCNERIMAMEIAKKEIAYVETNYEKMKVS